MHCFIVSIIGVAAWICDRAFCSFWLSISFPYLHSIWHVLILFGSNEAIVICVYSAIKQQNRYAKIQIHIWPNEKWRQCGLYYIRLYEENETNSLPYKSSKTISEKFITKMINSKDVPIQFIFNSDTISKRFTKFHWTLLK